MLWNHVTRVQVRVSELAYKYNLSQQVVFYRDWSNNEYFNCTENPRDNPSVERCGVPFSCCLPEPEAELVNVMCGFGVQEMPASEVITKVYTRGCIPSIQNYVESNLYIVGGIALGVAFAQLLGMHRIS